MAVPNFVFTFEGSVLRDGQEAPINDGFFGFDWSQAGLYNPDGSIPGYVTGSGDIIAFIAEAANNNVPGYDDAEPGAPLVFSRSTPFDVLSADFVSAFRDDLEITVTAFADEEGTQAIGTTTIIADAGVLQSVDFGTTLLAGARRIEINANDGDPSTLDYFGVDDIAIRNSTPTTIRFDEFTLSPGGETAIQDGFAGFQWSGVGVYSPDGGVPGYEGTSGANIGFIAEADGVERAGYEDHAAGSAAVLIAADAFQFRGGNFSSAFRDDLDLTINAYADAEGTILIGTATVQIDRGIQGLEFEDGVNVDGTFTGAVRLEFSSNDGNAGTLDYFGFDDLQFFL